MNQKIDDIKRRYVKLKDYIDEAGAFFRQKSNYSADEQIAFIVDFYANFTALVRIFEEEQNIDDTRPPLSVNVGKTTLTKKLIEQEFDAAVSVIYFNLSTQEILSLEERAKNVGNLKEALILRRLFEKFFNF